MPSSTSQPSQPLPDAQDAPNRRASDTPGPHWKPRTHHTFACRLCRERPDGLHPNVRNGWLLSEAQLSELDAAFEQMTVDTLLAFGDLAPRFARHRQMLEYHAEHCRGYDPFAFSFAEHRWLERQRQAAQDSVLDLLERAQAEAEAALSDEAINVVDARGRRPSKWMKAARKRRATQHLIHVCHVSAKILGPILHGEQQHDLRKHVAGLHRRIESFRVEQEAMRQAEAERLQAEKAKRPSRIENVLSKL